MQEGDGFQPELDGFAGERVHGPLVFFAIQPPETSRRAIANLSARLRKTHALFGKAIQPRNYHVSLWAPGRRLRALEDPVSAMARAADTVLMQPFEIEFDSAMGFSRNEGSIFDSHPYVLTTSLNDSPIHQFRHKLERAMRVAGFAASSSFKPHLTLAYDPTRCPVLESVSSISWTVDEFVLIQSVFGKGRHVVLARWPLTAPRR